ncbi:MAG: putative selenium-dependent hydroxylase accessory protein YqeC [Candidatus Marinimicrobia bacterium]|nr:putative selenium-dependent hydroxylase accessory protein YqeC [Candidatus Neomarinimicrobiota bacterium]
MNFYQILFDKPEEALGSCIAIMGGGGKTVLLNTLGNELYLFHDRVLLTSLTKSAYHSEQKVIFSKSIASGNLSELFSQYNPLHLMHAMIHPEKISGISEEKLFDYYKQSSLTIFECDGARNLPLKAHNDTDPTVPSFSTHVIILVGTDVLNTTVTEGKVHRPELFKSLWGVDDERILDIEFVTKVVTTKKGYLSKIPEHIRRIYFVNKADTSNENARKLALSIYRRTGCSTFYGSIHKGFWRPAQ